MHVTGKLARAVAAAIGVAALTTAPAVADAGLVIDIRATHINGTPISVPCAWNVW